MIDFNSDIHGKFMGKEFVMAPTNGKNRKRLQEAYDDVNELAEHSQWLKEERQKVLNDDRLKDETKQKRLDKLEKEFNKRTEGYEQTIQEHRKKALNIVVKEWIDEEPSDEFYDNDHFDDFALSRLVTFFLEPKEATLSSKQ